MRPGRSVALVGVAAAVASCGSTVELRRQLTLDGLQGPTSTATGSPAPGGSNVGPPGREIAGNPQPGSLPRPGTAGGPGPDATPHPGPSAPALRAAGPGVTATTIKIGIIFSDNANAANEAYGVEGTGEALDPRRLYRYAFDDQNRRGGILGRRLVPVFFNVDSNTGFASQMQAACSAFTEDDRVFAVFAGYFMNDSLRECLHRKGVVVLLSGISVSDQHTFDRFPAYVEVSMMNLTRSAALVADRLATKAFLTRGSRIGVVTFDQPEYRRARDEGTKRALARHGLRVTAEATIPIAHTTDQVGAQGAAISGVVLKFRDARVDRVLFVESSGDIALLFMTAAETQGYRPDYGLGSGDGGALLASNVAPTQLEGAQGVGWLPVLDVHADQDPDAKAPPARRRCLAMFASRGERFERVQYPLPLGICDQVWFLATAGTSSQLDRDSFAAAVSAVGSRYDSTMALLTRFAPGKHDGGNGYRDFTYVSSCTCYHWTSGVRRLG